MDNVQYIQDHGNTFDTGTGKHHLVLYRASSGAYVFGAGTVQWVWGLDPFHDLQYPHQRNKYVTRAEIDSQGIEPVVAQATVNIFADMGVQPSTLRADELGLVYASKTTDGEPPTSAILATMVGELSKSIIVVSEAADGGGGVVAGLEVSFDGGVRFHPSERMAADAVLAETRAKVEYFRANPESAQIMAPEFQFAEALLGVLQHKVGQESLREVWVCKWGATPGEAHYDDPWSFYRAYGQAFNFMTRAVDDSCNIEAMHDSAKWHHKDEF